MIGKVKPRREKARSTEGAGCDDEERKRTRIVFPNNQQAMMQIVRDKSFIPGPAGVYRPKEE